MPDSGQENQNILFSGDVGQDVLRLCHYVDQFCAAIGILEVVPPTPLALSRVVWNMTEHIPWPDGADKASPFKKAASFTVNFIAERPITTPFSMDKFGKLADHQNAIVAFHLSVDALHNAVIEGCDREPRKLENRIEVSQHFYRDMIVALNRANSEAHFRMVALLYESLAYQANPDIAYQPRL